MVIKYGEEELAHLRKKDKLLAELIDKVGIIYRKKDEDFFSSVVHHIIGQQISIKAQETIWNRLKEKIGIVDHKGLLSISSDELQSVGLSFRKTEYIIDFARKIDNKKLVIDELVELDDDDLIKELVKLKGIGKWTAEMIMIFCLDRKNIMSFDDLGIHRGLRMLYHHRHIDRKKFNKYKRRYSPYATVASLYLWEISSGKVDGMKDYAPKKKVGKKGGRENETGAL